jgi:hypothetical protein
MDHLGEAESKVIQRLTVVECDALVLSPTTLGCRHARTVRAEVR